MEQHIGKILETVNPQTAHPSNAAPAKHEPRQLSIGALDSSETELSKCLKGTQVAKAPMKRIEELFRRCMLKVGLRAANFPSKEESIVLFNHLIKNYGLHTIEEIDLAFEMAITGKLDVDANAYENFSCVFISKIINAYRIWASQAINHIRLKTIPHQVISFIEWGELIERDYQKFRSGKFNYRLAPVEYYDKLVSDGFMYAFLYKDQMDYCRQQLCSEVHLKIVVENNPLKSAIEQYDSTKDLEIKLVEYRSGKRDIEVVLLAKQSCVLMLFEQAKEKGYTRLYFNTESK